MTLEDCWHNITEILGECEIPLRHPIEVPDPETFEKEERPERKITCDLHKKVRRGEVSQVDGLDYSYSPACLDCNTFAVFASKKNIIGDEEYEGEAPDLDDLQEEEEDLIRKMGDTLFDLILSSFSGGYTPLDQTRFEEDPDPPDSSDEDQELSYKGQNLTYI
jgi:hypothetical protein